MKLSLNWLLDHIELNQLSSNPTKISELLTILGLEVESLSNPAIALKEFLIGQVLEVKNHPNADRLKICKVDLGNKKYDVVCGASNVIENQKVVFAPIGSTIPSTGMVLKKKEIRGVMGEGMLCSEKELGVGDDYSGILELPKEAPIGKLYYEWANLSDYIFDIAITPNRGDCTSVKGIAREIYASTAGNKLIEKSYHKIEGQFKSPVNWHIDLEKNKNHFVPYVKGRYFRGIKNVTSPEWLQRKLISIGLKPISALVDLTNYLTFDLGRPLHVFDAKKIQGDLTMRMARNKEKLLALDGNEYQLSDKNLIIADNNGPQSIAGVIGGMGSGCDSNTSEMFLESAVFDKSAVALNGRSLNIISDARYRFERGLDPNSVDFGVDIMSRLVLDICGGEVSEEVWDGALNEKHIFVNFRTSQLKRIGGIEIEKKSIVDILNKLGFLVLDKKKYLKVEVPPWRHDINEEVDLVEEIMRVHGYSHIPRNTIETNINNYSPSLNLHEYRARVARDTLARRGLIENISFSFLSKKDAQFFLGDFKMVEIDNPISQDLSVMRPSLIPNLINYLSKNKRNGLFNNGIFEVSSIFSGENSDNQIISAAAIREGEIDPRHWSIEPRNVDIYDIKADALEVFMSLGVNVNNIKLKSNAPGWYHPGRSASFSIGKFLLGYFGELHPKLAQHYEMKPVFFEIYPENIPGKNIDLSKKDFISYNLMPIKRDFAFWVDKDVLSEDLVNKILQVGKNNNFLDIPKVSIFDVYEENSKKGKKSLALEVLIQPINETLKDKQILEISNLIVNKLNKDFGAILRK